MGEGVQLRNGVLTKVGFQMEEGGWGRKGALGGQLQKEGGQRASAAAAGKGRIDCVRLQD